jgi:Pentapeptide repeats (8 copies)
MSTYLNSIFLACFLLYLISVPIMSPTASAEEPYNLNIGVSGTQQETPTATLTEQTTDSEMNSVKPKKKLRKEFDDDESVKVPAPNVKMTIPQVMSVLRSTRDLSGSNLSGLSLVGLNMSRANLKGANLSKANLERADFTESNLERVDLKGANLKMVSFFQSAMTAADLKGAALDNAIWVDKRVCAEGSIGQCLEKPAAVQSTQSTLQGPAVQTSQPQLTQQPATTPTEPAKPPAQTIQPIQPPVPPLQPIQPPVLPAQTQQQAPTR